MRVHMWRFMLPFFIVVFVHPVGASNAATKARELWVTSQGTNTIYIRGFPNAEEALGQITLPPGAQPHIITFHSGAFAYVSGMGDGRLYIVDANRRQIVQTLPIGNSLTHQARVSPDGTIALVAVLADRKLVKVAVNEAEQSWSIRSTLSFFPLGKSPICTIFRADSRRAYVSMLPSGIAVVDVSAMTLVKTLETDGFIACGMIRTQDGSHAVIASSGGGGHIYSLDMMDDSLEDRGTLGAASWHSFNMSSTGTLGFGTSPLSDELVVIDLTTRQVAKKATIPLKGRPGTAPYQPDALGGGEPVSEGVVPVSLRAAGLLALVDVGTLSVKAYIPISTPAPFDPMTCNGCAIHGVSVRP